MPADVQVVLDTKVVIDQSTFTSSINTAIEGAEKSAQKLRLRVDEEILRGSIQTALNSIRSKSFVVPVRASFSVADLKADLKAAMEGMSVPVTLPSGTKVDGIVGSLKTVESTAKKAAAAVATIGNNKSGGMSKVQLDLERISATLTQAQSKITLFNEANLGINTQEATSQLTALTEKLADFKTRISQSDGTMALSKYKAEFNAIKAEADSLMLSLKQIGNMPVKDMISPNASASVQKILKDVNTLEEAAQQLATRMKGVGNETQSAWDKFKNFRNITSVFRTAISNIWSFYMYAQMFSSTVIEIDSAMTQLKIVTQETGTVMEKFSQDVYEIASRTASSITDLIDSTTTYARLGYTLDESSVLAEYTAMLQNVGDIDAETAQNAITAIIKAFDISAEDIEDIMDKLVTVGNNFPISVSQIAEGMNNASSMMESAGNSFEETVALLTAANTTVQNISKSSTGLRTIAARIRNTTTELDELGESMTTAQYDELVKALTQNGVSLTDQNGELRSTYDILKDLSEVWDTLAANEQAALAETLSGTRQQNVLTSIVNNFSEATGAISAMTDSEGALSEANDVYMDSMTAKIQQVKNAWAEFTQQLLTSDFVSSVLDLVKSLIKVAGVASDIIGSLGGLRTILVALIGMGINKALTSVIGTVTKIRVVLPALWSSLKTGTVTVRGLSTAVSGLSLAATAASVAIGLFQTIINLFTSDAKDTSEVLADEHKRVTDLAQAYADYVAVVEDVDSTLAQKNTARYELINTLDLEYEKVQALIDLYDGDYSKAMAAAYYQSQVLAANEAIDAFEDRKSDLVGVFDELGFALEYWLDAERNVYSDTSMEAGELAAAYTALTEAGYDARHKAGGGLSLAFEFDANDADSIIEYYNQMIDVQNILSSSGLSSTSLYEQIEVAINNLKPVIDDLDESASDIATSLLDATANYLKETGRYSLDAESDYKKYRQELIKTIEASEEFTTVLKYQGYTAEQLVDIYLSCDESCAQYYETTAVAAQQTTTFAKKLNAIAEAADNANESITALEESLKEDDYNDNFESAVGYFEKMAELVSNQAWGSKDLAAYTEFFGTDNLETLQYYFGDASTGVSNFLNVVEQLQDTDLSGIASFDSVTGSFSYEVDKVDEFADALGISSAALQTLIDMVHYYSDDWENVSALDAAMWLEEEGAIKKVGDSLYLNRTELEKYADGTNLTAEQVSDLVQQMQALSGYEGLKIGDSLGLDSEHTGTNFLADIKSLNTMIDRLQELGGTAQESAAIIASEFDGITDADYVVDVLMQSNVSDYYDLSTEIARLLPEDLTVEYDLETRTFYNTAADVETELDNVSDTEATPTIDLDDGTFNYKIYKAKQALNDFGATTSTATIDVQYNSRRISGQYEGFAHGVNGDYEGDALLGDEYSTDGSPRPEMVVGDGYAYIAGSEGPEIRHLNRGDRVYTYNQTKKIVNSTFSGSIPSFAGGHVGGGAWSGGSDDDDYSYDYSDSSTSSSSDDSESWFEKQYKLHKHYRAMDQETDAEYFAWLSKAWKQAYAEGLLTEEEAYQYEEEVYDARGLAFEEEYDYHQHLVEMGQETDQEYYTWLNQRYQEAYANNEITLEDYYKYQEEVYEKSKELVDDYFNDIDHKIDMLENAGKSDTEIISWDEQGMQYVEEQIAKLREEGYTDNDEEIQELQDQWWSYYNDKKDREEEIKDDAKEKFEELVDYRKEMLEKQLEEEKEAEKDSLNERLDNLKEFYSKQKELLQDEADEEDYLEEQAEKRKKVSDLEAQLAQLELDNSAWAQKKKLELEQDLVEAKKDLTDFEKDYAREQAEKLLDETQELQEKEIEQQIEAVEDKNYTEEELRNQAIEDIKNGDEDLFNEMVDYNNKYGTGNAEDIQNMWDEAETALERYKDTFDELYQGTDLLYGNDLREEVDTSKIEAGENPIAPDLTQYTLPTQPTEPTPVEDVQPSAPTTPAEPYVGQVVQLKSGGLLSGSSDQSPSLYAADWVYGSNLYVQSTSGYSNAPIHLGTGPDINDSSTWVGWVNKAQLVGYASGTANAIAGLHTINELGDEAIFTSANGNTYKMLSSGDHVFSAQATDFLYNLANGEPNTITKFIADAFSGIPSILGGGMINNITQGNIIINGSCNEKTVSEIRREQRASVDYMLKEINRLAKA